MRPGRAFGRAVCAFGRVGLVCSFRAPARLGRAGAAPARGGWVSSGRSVLPHGLDMPMRLRRRAWQEGAARPLFQAPSSFRSPRWSRRLRDGVSSNTPQSPGDLVAPCKGVAGNKCSKGRSDLRQIRLRRLSGSGGVASATSRNPGLSRRRRWREDGRQGGQLFPDGPQVPFRDGQRYRGPHRRPIGSRATVG